MVDSVNNTERVEQSSSQRDGGVAAKLAEEVFLLRTMGFPSTSVKQKDEILPLLQLEDKGNILNPKAPPYNDSPSPLEYVKDHDIPFRKNDGLINNGNTSNLLGKSDYQMDFGFSALQNMSFYDASNNRAEKDFSATPVKEAPDSSLKMGDSAALSRPAVGGGNPLPAQLDRQSGGKNETGQNELDRYEKDLARDKQDEERFADRGRRRSGRDDQDERCDDPDERRDEHDDDPRDEHDEEDDFMQQQDGRWIRENKDGSFSRLFPDGRVITWREEPLATDATEGIAIWVLKRLGIF